jgi:hypothetical protein
LAVALLAVLASCGGAASGDQATFDTHPDAAPTTTIGVTTVPIVTSMTESDDASVFTKPEAISVGSCAFEYNSESLAERSWAFDGTLVSVGDVADSQMGSVPAATFEVTHWYRGGDSARVTVQFDMGTIGEFVPEVATGARLLVAGEPRWGGQALDDPVAWGCGFTQPWSSTSARQWSAAFDAAQTAALDGPVIRYPQRSGDTEQLAALVSGVLQLEGPCLYVLSHESGERYPVVWPAGTHWDEASNSVVSPTGEPMPIGGEVSGGGGYFYVPDVEHLVGPEAASLASQCVDNQYGEIAMVNNLDTGIAPVAP